MHQVLHNLHTVPYNYTVFWTACFWMQHIYRTYNTEFRSDLGITEITRRLWHEQESNSKIPFSKSGHVMSRQVVIYSSLSCLKPWNINLKMEKRQWKWLTYPAGLWKCTSNPNLGLDSGHGTRQVNWDCFQRQHYWVVNPTWHFITLVINCDEMC